MARTADDLVRYHGKMMLVDGKSSTCLHTTSRISTRREAAALGL